MVAYDDFAKLDLRVAEIMTCEAVPSSKKLFKIQIDLGFEKRTIVSGIKQHYAPEDLIGKKVVVLANLKPTKIMGIESQGMLLAGHSDSGLEVALIQKLPNGSVVT